MGSNVELSNDYAFSRVPASARYNLFTLTIIRIGFMTALSQFMIGAQLGYSFSFWEAMLATLLGSLVLEFVSLGLGVAGAREGLSTSLLSRWCGFGRKGSALIGILIAISLLGWFGVQNTVFAQALHLFFTETFNIDIGINVSSIITGMGLAFLVGFGFRSISWIAKITVPFFFLVIAYILFDLLRGHSIAELFATLPSGPPLSLGAAATAVAGGYIVGALTAPDMSRFCRSDRDVFWMMTAAIIVGEFIVVGISVLVARALDTADVVTIMTTSAGTIGLLATILAAAKINDMNIYSSSLAFAGAFNALTGKTLPHKWLTIALGAVGTTLSILEILNVFTTFLIILGVIFPPIAGVMLIEYFVIRTHRAILEKTRKNGTLPDDSQTPSIGWAAIFACITGSFVGLLTSSAVPKFLIGIIPSISIGIPSLNSLFGAAVAYMLFTKICKN